ncbi:Pkinase-domain-containing protein [Gonapodya prolifera JEL478]|uniref:Pkinase-domain-containing protein n=1 Tax=Gonapodya prolifera (strain JEL478) TaxID=1344416 RepID=A0A139B058_GONPJ|nr:Pkinase-domain-containing protein [Gonapodya prolifera JEL478]|eukprot:KXS22354.1 Pkinase-domain-containing protein [Gonapodya prolifera JEL478]
MQKYRIEKQLGDGSFGWVLRATNIETGETVAIKKMKKKFPTWDECVQLREVKALKRLNDHPNIVRLREVVRERDELHFVFEFMEENLYQYMRAREGSDLGEETVKIIAYQICAGLAHMHKNGFFHRDMKPENLLMRGSAPLVKIADLGLAREIRSRPPYTEYVSTRWYRAPEVSLRSPAYSSPVDMWALGCIVAELFSLRPLFPGSSELDQMSRIAAWLGTPLEQPECAADRRSDPRAPSVPVGGGAWSGGWKLATAMGFRFPLMTARPLSEFLPPWCSPLALNFISQCLRWDPAERCTAARALQHPWFEGVVVGLDGVPSFQTAKTSPSTRDPMPSILPPLPRPIPAPAQLPPLAGLPAAAKAATVGPKGPDEFDDSDLSDFDDDLEEALTNQLRDFETFKGTSSVAPPASAPPVRAPPTLKDSPDEFDSDSSDLDLDQHFVEPLKTSVSAVSATSNRAPGQRSRYAFHFFDSCTGEDTTDGWEPAWAPGVPGDGVKPTTMVPSKPPSNSSQPSHVQQPLATTHRTQFGALFNNWRAGHGAGDGASLPPPQQSQGAGTGNFRTPSVSVDAHPPAANPTPHRMRWPFAAGPLKSVSGRPGTPPLMAPMQTNDVGLDNLLEELEDAVRGEGDSDDEEYADNSVLARPSNPPTFPAVSNMHRTPLFPLNDGHASFSLANPSLPPPGIPVNLPAVRNPPRLPPQLVSYPARDTHTESITSHSFQDPARQAPVMPHTFQDSPAPILRRTTQLPMGGGSTVRPPPHSSTAVESHGWMQIGQRVPLDTHTRGTQMRRATVPAQGVGVGDRRDSSWDVVHIAGVGFESDAARGAQAQAQAQGMPRPSWLWGANGRALGVGSGEGRGKGGRLW